MSFVMIAAGSSSRSRIRMVSLRLLMLGSGVGAAVLLVAGAGAGYAVSMLSASAPVAREVPRAAMPFAVEQLGALSGRLFKLESQAGQLTDRIRAMQGAAGKEAPASNVKAAAGSGGPMLPPRLEQEAIDNFDALQTRAARLEQQIALVGDAAALHHLASMRMPTRLPIENAELVSLFGNRDDPFTGRRAFHAGLDFAATPGTLIRAAAGGKVVFAGFRADYGWVVEIEHGNGLTTRYGHASRLLVKPGALVMPGDAVAAVGSTGRSTGPHLHFEVLRNGESTDPRRYLAGL